MIDKCLPQLRWLQVSRRGRDEAQMRATGISFELLQRVTGKPSEMALLSSAGFQFN